ncbi:GNAT family N-acetyltransferase [Stappia sp. ES.058]|uniref:GNAT family N-acetyltransferase n=1 Tax=Stappia sp. ES.058 TaxID=1881061 RepID=UPI00087C9A06|nr:GNAT family N-acetyltransferase [Stappia sp. ES.058]SDT97961.1 Acetyltransferase (GNAT) domain-containing protein [Stappia sp. ES.058]
MSAPTTRIRAYDPETDLKRLSGIWLDASLLAHAFVGRQRLREQRVRIETEYLPNAETWVACRGDGPVGFISLLDDLIGGLFVAPRHHGQGIGRALVAHALALKGELSLEVYTANTPAVAFYQALGFRERSRRARDDEDMPFENACMVLKR